MIYRLDDLVESHDFDHDQKFVKAEHWKEACDELEDKVKTIIWKNKELASLRAELAAKDARIAELEACALDLHGLVSKIKIEALDDKTPKRFIFSLKAWRASVCKKSFEAMVRHQDLIKSIRLSKGGEE